MTRSEFIQNIETLSDLFEFCNDNDITEITEGVYSDDELQSYIADEARDYIREYGWVDLRDALDNIPCGYDFYRNTGYMQFDTIDGDEFDGLKEETLRLCDENYDIWDEEDEDEITYVYTEEQTQESDEEQIPDESITSSDLFAFAHQAYIESRPITKEEAEQTVITKEEENEMDPLGFFF
jgi:hypothetical protein